MQILHKNDVHTPRQPHTHMSDTTRKRARQSRRESGWPDEEVVGDHTQRVPHGLHGAHARAARAALRKLPRTPCVDTGGLGARDAALELDNAEARHAAEAQAVPAKAEPTHDQPAASSIMPTMHCDCPSSARRRRSKISPMQRGQTPANSKPRDASRRHTR